MIRSHFILQSAMADEIDENDERALALEIMDGHHRALCTLFTNCTVQLLRCKIRKSVGY